MSASTGASGKKRRPAAPKKEAARIHREKVEAHAEERLKPAIAADAPRSELLAEYKKFLKIEERRVEMIHRAGGGGVEVAKRRSQVIDIVLENAFGAALEHAFGGSTDFDGDGTATSPVNLVAIGGYGRGVLNPGSDVDLLFLTTEAARSLSEQAEAVIEEVLYLLWDCGFKVGHATRSIGESLTQANEDPQTRTAMIEMRLLMGDGELFEELKARFHKSCVAGRGKTSTFLDDRFEDRKVRHAKYSNTIYLQEPHVKEGVGGLRDYHNLRWLTFVKFATPDIGRLVTEGLLTEGAMNELEKAHDFLLRVRNDLHYEESPPTDVLSLRLQGVVANHFEYPQKTILRRIETFMRDYYMHTRNVLNRSGEVYDVLRIQHEESGALARVTGLLPSIRGVKFDGFFVRSDRVYPDHPEVFDEDPARLMRLFLQTQRRGLRMSAELVNLVQAAFVHVNRSFRINRPVYSAFEAILSQKGSVGFSLRQMHRIGFLGRYLPEFGALDCLVQHEFFHRYTADEHTLCCIDNLDALSGGNAPGPPVMAEIFEGLVDPFPLYLALIMHDAGRAANMRTHADASTVLADRVMKRLRVKGERRRLVIFLVDHHLTLWSTATTKNLDDPEVIAEFAGIVGTKEYLDILLVMTFVDSSATSDESWTSWKEMLILQLYRTTVAYLKDGEAYQREAAGPSDELLRLVRKRIPKKFRAEVDAHFEQMPAHYFPPKNPAGIDLDVRHFHAYFKQIASDDPEEVLRPYCRWYERYDEGYTKLVVTSWDRHGLLARVAGALAASGLNILSADFFRRGDDLVLDVFRVCQPDLGTAVKDRQKKQFQKLMDAAAPKKSFDLDTVIEGAEGRRGLAEKTGIDVPRRASVTNDDSHEYTVIRIQTPDRLGLLYDIFCILSHLGLDVGHARISTEKGAAIDTFYVKDIKGDQILDEAELAKIQRKIEGVVL